MHAITKISIEQLAEKIAADVAKNAGTAAQLCYAPALFALQDALLPKVGQALTKVEPLEISEKAAELAEKYAFPGAIFPAAQASFQLRVRPWMLECFGQAISDDLVERNHRFLEEALELVQSTGCTQGEAHELVDYVFGRPVGEPEQEVGGVMVTLAALCLAGKMDMHAAGDKELTRVWTKVEQIRAKQAAKPKFSPLPVAPLAGQAPVDGVHWDQFPAYLIDKCEGETITEEGLQAMLAAMLEDPDYMRIAAERASPSVAQPVSWRYRFKRLGSSTWSAWLTTSADAPPVSDSLHQVEMQPLIIGGPIRPAREMP